MPYAAGDASSLTSTAGATDHRLAHVYCECLAKGYTMRSTSSLYLGREWNIDHNQVVKVKDAELRYAVLGEGEPIVFVHGITIADGLTTPLKFFPPLFEDYQIISYYRAGYNGSKLYADSISIEDGALHIKELLDHLGIDKAHICAFSFGGVIGFQFLLSYPERAYTGILMEPYMPRETPDAIQKNIDAYEKALAIYKSGDKLGAVQQYMYDVCGPSFNGCVDMTGPLDVWKRAEECVDTTFKIEFPSIMAWPFRMSKADEMAPNKPTMPILAVMGLDSESVFPGFRDTQRFLMNWLPQAERAGIMNATHGLQNMNPVGIAESIYNFLKKHPMR